MSDANAELEEKLKDVRTDLQDSAIEMDRMTEEYTKLKMVLQQTDKIVEEMRKERDVLRAQVCNKKHWKVHIILLRVVSIYFMYLLSFQVQDLRAEVSAKTDNDDEILAAVNTKVDEWKV